MKNTQKGFIVPLLIAIIAVLAIGGGVYVYEQSKPVKTDGTTTTTDTQTTPTTQNTTTPIADNSVKGFISVPEVVSQISSLWGVKLIKNAKGQYSTGTPGEGSQFFSINLIARGDLNADNLEDVVVWGTQCGGSCGSNFTVILNQKTGPLLSFSVSPENFISSSAAQYSVKNMNITDGKLIIEATVPQFDGQTTTSTLSYNLVGKNLVKVTTSLPNSNVSQTDPLADIQVLSNVVPAGSFNIVKGGLSACQPEFFDPRVTKFQMAQTGGSPAELYKIAGADESVGMMINGWSKEGENKISLASPFDLTIYEFGCASSFSFVADVTKNAVRQSLFTNIDNFLNPKSVSEDKTHIFLVNNIKGTNGDWQLKKRIVNVENDTKVDLPNMSCVSDFGFWNGNKLLTYSDRNLPSNSNSDKTKICVWNTDGKLLSQVSADLYWGAASADYLRAQIGLLPKDSNIFYTYDKPNTYGQKGCYVNFQDLNNQSRNRKIKIGNYDTSKTICPDIEMDLSNTTFDSNTIPYQIVTQ